MITQKNINLLLFQVDFIDSCKVSEVLPHLRTIAIQNKLNLSNSKEFERAKHILKVSILSN